MKMAKFVITANRCHRLYFVSALFVIQVIVKGQNLNQELNYTVSMSNPANHLFQIELQCKEWNRDTVDFRIPQWMPGYYQIMDYWKGISDFTAQSTEGINIPVNKTDNNTWRVIKSGKMGFIIKYNVRAEKRFVANSFLDATHGYIAPAATFMYIVNHISHPAVIKINTCDGWNMIATGLEPVAGKNNEFVAPDFDVLYDSPLLIGNLDTLPSFSIQGISHRFIAFNPGSFDRESFIAALKKTVEAGINVIGEIPYMQYTFIGIGPGPGGIEHLNNTTVSFSGKGLDNPESMKRMLKFLAHEYFHNYNVKRIRPFELGPFDYNTENRTNLLWVSEGLSVYYEYLMVRRAGLINDDELLSSIADNINAYENDRGRTFQSLTQASYNTWSDGPFGNKNNSEDRSISYYDKGPVIGMILDLTIRNATENNRTLDDVMRILYYEYYKKLNRGFTDAEFQQVCEEVAGVSLSREFEYVNTTKEIDYALYLSYAGVTISQTQDKNSGEKRFALSRINNMNSRQRSVYNKWLQNDN